MTAPRFELQRTSEEVLWAEALPEDTVRLHRTRLAPREEDTVLADLTPDMLRNLLAWADGDRAVTVSLTGVLAREVQQNARHLGLTNEMFVGHAVRLFLEAGRG